MIHSENNKLNMKGSIPILCVEIEHVLKSFKELLINEMGDEIGEETYKFMLSNVEKSDEELDEQCDEAFDELINDEMFMDFVKAINKMVKEKKHE